MIQPLIQRLHDFVWASELQELSNLQRRLRHFLRIVLMVGRDLKDGQLTLRAMGLVYTTLLSFVPLIAVSFSVLKGFGVHNQMEPFLLNLLSPLGDKSIDITQSILGFVENMEIGVLGALGLGMLMYTVISLIQKIEASLNFAWRLSSERKLADRFSKYLSVVMVGPVLVFSALGITASLKSHSILSAIESMPYMGDAIQLLGLLVPTLMIILAFGFVYKMVPNTQVQLRAALYGAIIGGILWKLTGSLFASFASGSTSYTAIYSGFAILLLFMIWLYLGWLILLVGASFSYYYQNPHSLRFPNSKMLFSAEMRERMALQLMIEIGRAHHQPEQFSATSESLIKTIQAPQMMTERMLQSLLQSGLILISDESDKRYLPAKAMDQLPITEILHSARSAEDEGLSSLLHQSDAVNEISRKVSASIQASVGDKTLHDLVLQSL